MAHRFTDSCVRHAPDAPAITGATSEPVDAFWKANIDLTDFTPDLDLWDRRLGRSGPIPKAAAAGESSSTTRKNGAAMRCRAVSSMVSGGCIVSGTEIRELAAVHTASTPIPSRSLDHAGAAALYVTVNRAFRARLTQCGDRSWRSEHSRRAGGRRGPGRGRQVVPRVTDRRRDADHPGDARPGGKPRCHERSCLSPRSARRSIKTGGLADVVGCPSGKALKPPRAGEVRTLLPGYPPVMAAIRQGGREIGHSTLRNCFGGTQQGHALRARRPASIFWCWTRRISTTGRDAIYLGCRRQGLSRQSRAVAALSWVAAAAKVSVDGGCRRLDARYPASCTTGRRGLHRSICVRLRVARPRPGTLSSPSTTSPFTDNAPADRG